MWLCEELVESSWGGSALTTTLSVQQPTSRQRIRSELRLKFISSDWSLFLRETSVVAPVVLNIYVPIYFIVGQQTDKILMVLPLLEQHLRPKGALLFSLSVNSFHTKSHTSKSFSLFLLPSRFPAVFSCLYLAKRSKMYLHSITI